MEIHVDVVVTTELSEDEWYSSFIQWLESRGEFCGGSIHAYEDCELRKCCLSEPERNQGTDTDD